jgi:hypothetical protein
MGLLYTLLGIIGWGSEGLHFAIGLLGLAAVAGTPREKPRRQLRGSKRTKSVRKEPRNSKPRAQAARDRA